MRNKLSLASSTFKPKNYAIDDCVGVDAIKKALLKALPRKAISISKSRKPQQPIVFLSNFNEIALEILSEQFLHHEPNCDEGRYSLVEDLATLGVEIHEHINDAWAIGDDVTDRRGRPWKWDAEFVPSNRVIAFVADTAQGAYMRVVASMASIGAFQDLNELAVLMHKEKITEDDPEEYEAYQQWLKKGDETDHEFNYMTVNTDCEMLFIHFIDGNNLSVGSVKMRDVIHDAIEFAI